MRAASALVVSGHISAGDTAWMLIATALVLMMTPALGLFYAGLVRSKNTLNTFMMSIGAIAVAVVMWALVGYSLAFAKGDGFIGGLGHALMHGVAFAPRAGMAIPQLLFFAFQATFCVITTALVSGAVVERMRFGPFLVEPAVVTGLSAHELSVGVVCQAPSGDECVTGATEHKVWAAMYGATVTLSDPTPPTLSAPSGALWGEGEAGGFHKGTESVTVTAADVGGGVASIVLSADGRPVETYTAPCNFTFAQPCPSSTGTQTLTLPTTGLSDGTHTLALVATDAAGNQSTVASEQITVENSSPPPPVGLSATPTQAGGSTFTATWTDPAGQVAPITGALYQVCPASGSGSCSAPAQAPAAGPATVTVPGPGSWSIAVWLTNAAGNESPAAAAHTSVVVSPSGPGSSGSGTGTGHSAGTKPTIRVTETLRGRELVVHVSGPASGRVRVGFTGRLGGRIVASAAKTVALKRGRLTVVFKLGPRTAAHALIRVSAKLDHELAVTSTLRRSTSHHSKPKQ